MKEFEYSMLSIFTFILLSVCGFTVVTILDKNGVLDEYYLILMIVTIVIILFTFLIIGKIRKKYNLRKGLCNNICLNLLCFLFIIVLPQFIFFKGFEVINPYLSEFTAGSRIYSLKSDVDFNNELIKIFEIKDENSSELLSNYGIIHGISKNKSIVQSEFDRNNIIKSKLNQYGVKIDELFAYCDNYIKLHSNLYYIGYYIGTVSFLIIIYYLHRWVFLSENYELSKIKIRRNIYIVAFIIYLLSFIDTSNDGLFSFIINKVNGDIVLTKETVTEMLRFANTFKESFLTFIIFDTILDCKDRLVQLRAEKINVSNIAPQISDSFCNRDKCQSYTKKKIKALDSKYDVVRRNNIELEEKIKVQDTKINELNRKIKILTGNKN